MVDREKKIAGCDRQRVSVENEVVFAVGAKERVVQRDGRCKLSA